MLSEGFYVDALRLQAMPGLTSKRVLTMDYMDGVGVNDTQGLADMGADPAEVSVWLHSTTEQSSLRRAFHAVVLPQPCARMCCVAGSFIAAWPLHRSAA